MSELYLSPHVERLLAKSEKMSAAKLTVSDIAGAISDATFPLHQRIEALEARLAEFRYRGVWDDASDYSVGNFCSHGGSMWHCEQANKGQRPGNGGPQWAMAVKHGRDLK